MAKLLELIPHLKNYQRISRPGWCCDTFLVKSEYDYKPLIKCNFDSFVMGEYCLTYEDLLADDWVLYD